MHATFLKSFLPSTLPAFILIGIFLTPHGMGYRFTFGHVDIPRFIVLSVTAIWFVSLLRGFFKSKMIKLKMINLDPDTISIGALVILILMSAITSSSIFASSILAVQLSLLFFVFGFAYVRLFDQNQNNCQLNKAIAFIFAILFLFSVYEIVFQTYLIPHHFRTSFWGIAGFEWIMSRVLYRSGTILAQGPFMWNHDLSGLCAAGSGVILYMIDKSKIWGLLSTLFFVALLIATGTRAAFYGVAVAFFLYSAWSKNYTYVLYFFLSVLVLELLFKTGHDITNPIFYNGDINTYWIDHIEPLKKTSLMFSELHPIVGPILAEMGPVGIKIMGFWLNLTQIDEWWLLGYGFGSLQRPSLIFSTAIQYDDPGLIQLIFLESGLLAGSLLVFILIRSTLLSLKYEATKYNAVGITAWSIFALSSLATWPFVLAMIFVFKTHIFHWQKKHKAEG